MFGIIRFFVFSFILLFTTPSFAEDASDATIQAFFIKIQNLMNKRDISEIESFYMYFTDSSARFIKIAYLLNPEDKTKVVAQESLNMSKEEYITYIKDILKPLNSYAYRVTINKINREGGAGVAVVNYSVDEYTLIRSEKNEEEAAFISANCNMNVGLDSGDAVILSTNCIEKIVKRTN